MRRSRGRTECLPRFLPTGAAWREGVRRVRRTGPPLRGASGPRWPFGSPSGTRFCSTGRIPAGGASRGYGRRRLPPASPPRSPPSDFPLRAGPCTPYNASYARARLSARPPGIPGRCAGARSRGSVADVPPGGESLLAADRHGEAFAALCPAPRKDFPAAGRGHPFAEAVGSFPPQVVRLVCTFHADSLLPSSRLAQITGNV